MRILHTADLHLQCEGDARWNALQTILQIARTESIDLRTPLSDIEFETIILPGNHDRNSYKEGLYFGDKVTILSELTPLERE